MRQLGGPREVVVHSRRVPDGGLAGRPARARGEHRRRHVHPRLRRRLDGARRARFFVLCVSTCVYGRRTRPALGATPPSHAARPRRRRLCAAQGAPHRRRTPARHSTDPDSKSPKIKLSCPCRQLSVYVCVTAGSARRQRRFCTDASTAGIARRTAPKGSLPSPGRPLWSPGTSDEDSRRAPGARRCTTTERPHWNQQALLELASRSLNTAAILRQKNQDTGRAGVTRRWPAAPSSAPGRPVLRYHQLIRSWRSSPSPKNTRRSAPTSSRGSSE